MKNKIYDCSIAYKRISWKVWETELRSLRTRPGRRSDAKDTEVEMPAGPIDSTADKGQGGHLSGGESEGLQWGPRRATILRTAGRRGQGRGLGMVRAAGASKGSCRAGNWTWRWWTGNMTWITREQENTYLVHYTCSQKSRPKEKRQDSVLLPKLIRDFCVCVHDRM